jgi:hypothetical protein
MNKNQNNNHIPTISLVTSKFFLGFGCIISINHYRAPPFLGGTTKNYIKEWLGNQKQPNHFLRPFPLNIFPITNYYFFMFIHHMH